jgi:hypothetical protein
VGLCFELCLSVDVSQRGMGLSGPNLRPRPLEGDQACSTFLLIDSAVLEGGLPHGLVSRAESGWPLRDDYATTKGLRVDKLRVLLVFDLMTTGAIPGWCGRKSFQGGVQGIPPKSNTQGSVPSNNRKIGQEKRIQPVVGGISSWIGGSLPGNIKAA